MLYVYRTPFFVEKLNKKEFKGVSSFIDDIQSHVEQSQSANNFERFRDGFCVKKGVKKKYRLIAKKISIPYGSNDDEKHELLVFHDLIIRKDPEYNDPSDGFCINPAKFAERNHYVLPTFENDCKEYYKNKRQAENVIKPKGQLSDYEYNILYGMMRGHKTSGKDYKIYEMREWVSSLKSDENTDVRGTFIQNLYKGVCNAVARSAIDESENTGLRYIEFEYGSSHKKYIGYYFNQNESVVFLGPITKSVIEAQKFIEKNNDFFTTFDKERAVKRSLRSYSDAVIANENDHSLWKKIEDEAANNMALSSEELDILDSVQNSENRKYPQFINGRAGSGKSTILQFNFASYYYNYLLSENDDDASPVYFTYNDKLLTTARETVDSLLENHDYLGFNGNSEKDRERMRNKKIRSREYVYRNFSAFLLDVAKLNKKFNFLPQNHLTFQKFKEKWNVQFKSDTEVRKLTPEVCWHVIRTYIKGDSVESPVDVLDFENKFDSTISKENFKIIYNKVWKSWYGTLALYSSIDENDDETSFLRNVQAQFWDDQDLVRYVLEVNEDDSNSESLLDQYFRTHPRYCAVFCDESQDFTQIELEAILKTSLFLYKNVKKRDISLIPFVFAGDPFQTLNPTGFSWDAVKNSFVNVIAKSLDVDADDVKMNYKELKCNYRSEQEIVKVSNSVQMVRAAKLNPDRYLIEPQLPWSDEKGSALFFDWSDTAFWKWLERNQTVSFIVPCETDAKYDYVENNKALKEHICCVDYEPNNPKRYKYPIFSAQDVKGLEYDIVVVFGFGSYKDGNIGPQFKTIVESGPEEFVQKHSLELEYFINRLYVAVTRPKKQLFVLDDADTFWSSLSKKNTSDNSAVARLAKLVPQNCREAWLKEGAIEEKLSVPTMGRAENLKGEASSTAKEEFASQLYQEGVDNRDKERLNYALQAYISIFGENHSRCQEIQSCIDYLDGKYCEAAKSFENSGNKFAAHHCWFLNLPVPVISGPAIDGMHLLQKKNVDCEESNERRLAECAFENLSVDGFCSALETCCEDYRNYSEHCQHSIFTWTIDFAKWQDLFNDVLKKMLDFSLKESDVDRIVKTLDRQDVIGFDELILCKFFFKNKLYDKIIELESKNSNPDVQNLIKQAKIYKEGFPKNLPALIADKNYETVCKIWEEQGETTVDSLDATDIKNIFLAHREKKLEIEENLLVRMFNKFIDWQIWTNYCKKIKQKTYRYEVVQILIDILACRQDDNLAKKIMSGFKKCVLLKDVKDFNILYAYCVGIANEHPKGVDLQSCFSLLRKILFDMKRVIEKFDVSLAEVLQIGRFIEYVVSQIELKDRDHYWSNVVEFYRLLVENVYTKPEQILTLRKRIIFCQEKQTEDMDFLAVKGKNIPAANMLVSKSAQLKKEILEDRKSFGISDKIESVPKQDDTIRLASIAWRNEGFLIKHSVSEIESSTIVPELGSTSFDAKEDIAVDESSKKAPEDIADKDATEGANAASESTSSEDVAEKDVTEEANASNELTSPEDIAEKDVTEEANAASESTSSEDVAEKDVTEEANASNELTSPENFAGKNVTEETNASNELTSPEDVTEKESIEKSNATGEVVDSESITVKNAPPIFEPIVSNKSIIVGDENSFDSEKMNFDENKIAQDATEIDKDEKPKENISNSEMIAKNAAVKSPNTVNNETKVDVALKNVAPENLYLECCGYVFKIAKEDEFAIDIYAKLDREVYLGSCNSYGISLKHQKNFSSKNPPIYRYGNLPSFTIEETDDDYKIKVGIISLLVKKIL